MPARESHYLRRRDYLEHRLIGHTCRVEPIGATNPAKINYQGVMIPLPEYGVALWFDDPPKEDKEPTKPLAAWHSEQLGEWT
jgi:hypothetical protein